MSLDKQSDTESNKPLSDASSSGAVTPVENEVQEAQELLKSQSLSDLRLPIALCISTSFAGFIFGRFGTSVNKTTGQHEFSTFLIGLIISVFNAGCAIGGLTIPKLADIKGRKFAISFSILIYVIGLIVQATSKLSSKWYQFLIGRVITGLAIGSTSVLTPMFISESSPLKIRGAMVVFYQVMICGGILFGNLTNYGCKEHFSGSDNEWSVPVNLGFAWASLTLVGIFFMPESAVYKVNRHDDIEGAKKSIAKLNNIPVDSAICEEEVNKIVANKKIAELATSNNASWHEFLTGEPKLGFRLAIGMLVMFFQQFSGANYFFYYGTSLFSSVGIDDSYLTAIILSVVNFVATFFGIYLVEKLGRKTCLLYGSIMMFITMFVYACLGSFALNDGNDVPRKSVGSLMIVFTCLYLVGFATTWGPVAFVIVSEIFPVRVKATSISISTSINWISNFLISLFTPFITKAIGFKLGFVFAGCLFASILFVQFFVPETKGLRIEEVDEIFRSGKKETKDEEVNSSS